MPKEKFSRRRLLWGLASYSVLFPVCLLILLRSNSASVLAMLKAIAYRPYAVVILYAAWTVSIVGTVWIVITIYAKTKMEAWWWLSTPYSVLFPTAALVLGASGHSLAGFAELAELASISSAVWTLATVYQVAVSHRARLNIATTTMLLLSLIGALWWFIPAKS